MNTLVDPNVKPSKEELAIKQMSPHFKKDADSLLTSELEFGEELLWACNIVYPSLSPPYKFGYILITSTKALTVIFSSDLDRKHTGDFSPKLITAPLLAIVKEVDVFGSGIAYPTRPYQKIWLEEDTRFPVIAVDYPGVVLSQDEYRTREVSSYQLNQLVSCELPTAKASWLPG